MKETIIAIKDHYENVRGSKKVKLLTKGKKYVYLKSGYSDVTKGDHVILVNDIGITCVYKRSLFTTVSNSRNNKLDLLGI
jgi:DNA/RNA-binding domain of Phe-tRNA-synthetase-like protein